MFVESMRGFEKVVAFIVPIEDLRNQLKELNHLIPDSE